MNNPSTRIVAFLITVGMLTSRGEAGELSSMLLRLVEQAELPARVEGVLAEVIVEEGRLVSAGQLLAKIEDSDARLTESQAAIEAQIAEANAQADYDLQFAVKSVQVAEAELQRAVQSNQNFPKSVSDSELDRLTLLIHRSQLEVAQAQHAHRLAQLTRDSRRTSHQAARERLARHQVTAPFAGMIVTVHRHSGEWVTPGTPVARLLRLDRMRVEGFLPAGQATPALQNQPVQVTVEIPNEASRTFEGTIVFLDPEIDPVNGQVRVRAEIHDPELRLRPGMRASMKWENPPASAPATPSPTPTSPASPSSP